MMRTMVNSVVGTMGTTMHFGKNRTGQPRVQNNTFFVSAHMAIVTNRPQNVRQKT